MHLFKSLNVFQLSEANWSQAEAIVQDSVPDWAQKEKKKTLYLTANK
jgi:hypothetical protein